MANKQITVVHKKVGERPQVVEVENDFRVYQQLVGGLFQVLYLDNGLILGFDEEGLYKKYRPNLQIDLAYVLIPNNQILGDVFITVAKGADFRSLTENEQQNAMAFLEEFAILHRKAK